MRNPRHHQYTSPGLTSSSLLAFWPSSPLLSTGTFGGKLKTLTATELGTIATKAAFTEFNVDPKVKQA